VGFASGRTNETTRNGSNHCYEGVKQGGPVQILDDGTAVACGGVDDQVYGKHDYT